MNSVTPVTQSILSLERADRELVEAAAACMKNAYAPYSRFHVGAAARTTSGRIYAGCNLENASYGLTLCAEAIALGGCAAGGDFLVESIAIVGGLADGSPASSPVFPCGRCRQLIREAADVSGCDIRVLASASDGKTVALYRISELLPLSFGPSSLV